MNSSASSTVKYHKKNKKKNPDNEEGDLQTMGKYEENVYIYKLYEL